MTGNGKKRREKGRYKPLRIGMAEEKRGREVEGESVRGRGRNRDWQRGGQGPPSKREHSRCAQKVLLVASAESISYQDPKGRPYRCLNTNGSGRTIIPPLADCITPSVVMKASSQEGYFCAKFSKNPPSPVSKALGVFSCRKAAVTAFIDLASPGLPRPTT